MGLANLAALLSGGLQPPFEPALPPCVLEAVCPPAWLPPDPGETCPPCPEAPPCPSVQPVCPAPEPREEKPAEDPWGAAFAAVPGLLVALLLEVVRALQACWRRARQDDDGRATSPAPALRGGGVVR